MAKPKRTLKEKLEHAERMAAHWQYLARQAEDRGDVELAERHFAREQKWFDEMNRLEGN